MPFLKVSTERGEDQEAALDLKDTCETP